MSVRFNGTTGISTPNIDSSSYNQGQLAGFRNKIINGRFNINQAGAASRTAAVGYNFDQWYYDSTYLYQPIPTEDVYDGTYTLAWEGNSTAAWSLNATGSAGQGSQTYTPVVKGGQIVVSGKTNQHLWVRFAGDLLNLNKVQLEVGNVATPFEDRPYSQELYLCQRFFETISATNGEGCIVLYYTNANNYQATYALKARKRTTPSVAGAVGFNWVGAGASSAGSDMSTDFVKFYAQNPAYFSGPANSVGILISARI